METRKKPQTGERQQRDIAIKREAINQEGRTVDLAFASEAGVRRWYGTEILECSGSAVDLRRMLDGAPLLLGHNSDQQIGVIEAARVDADKVCRATVRFSRSPLAEEIFRDVCDGIRRCISVGYSVNKWEVDEEEEEWRATSWEPHEVSIVSMPADTSVGIGRAAEPAPVDTPARGMADTTTPEKPAAQGVQIDESAMRAAAEAEMGRVRNVMLLGEKFGARDEAEKAVRDKTSLEAFQTFILTERMGAKPAPLNVTTNVGMSEKETKRFSILKAVREVSERGLTGLEKEACDEALKRTGRQLSGANSFVLPGELEDSTVRTLLSDSRQTRAQTAGQFTAGGALVQFQYGAMIELLRNKAVLGRAGISILSGVVGDLFMPQQTGAATAYWVGETAALTDSQAAFAQKQMTPKRVGGTIPYSRQFLAQASIDAENFLRNELMTVCNLAIDLAGLEGTGANGQPLGVKNTPGVGADVTYGGAATWAKVILSETKVNTANADIGAIGWVLSSATVGAWKGILRASAAGAKFLIDDDMTANSYPVYRTNQLTSNQSYFGVWSQLMLAMWAGTEVIVDPYSLAKSAQVQITMQSLCDYLVRQPTAFQVSTDTAAA